MPPKSRKSSHKKGGAQNRSKGDSSLPKELLTLSERLGYLPFDIIQHILERAALSNKRTCHSLTLVSQTVQTWADPFVFRKVIIASPFHARKVIERFTSPNKSTRFIRGLSFVQTFAAPASCSFMFTWAQLVEHFSGLVVLYLEHNGRKSFIEGVGDTTEFQPASIPTLRRIGGGYGSRTIHGSWTCVQTITHLDLSEMSSSYWRALENRNFRLLPTLSHLSVRFDKGETPKVAQHHLQVLAPLLPPSVLLCLVKLDSSHELIKKEFNALSRWAFKLDDRFLLFASQYEGFIGEWVLNSDLMDEFGEWAGDYDECDTYWVQGLNMVNQRRQILSYSD
ncbi:hypothetical protein DL96DRAFT_1589075 [Flagelloscypha sp. PMI_526]|nr:hypothetical protein DL96DRAFT_1589075 [Flagelloscypha sp. PMI_526]